MHFTAVDPAAHAEAYADHPSTQATSAELRLAARAGREAFAEDHPNAPGIHPTIRDLIGDAPVGQPRTLALMEAFQQAWTAARDAEASALGYDPGTPITVEEANAEIAAMVADRDARNAAEL